MNSTRPYLAATMSGSSRWTNQGHVDESQLVEVGVLRRRPPTDAGVQRDRIQPAATSGRGLVEVPDPLGGAEVDLAPASRAVSEAVAISMTVRFDLRFVGGDHDVVPVLRELLRERPSDAGRRTGDEGELG